MDENPLPMANRNPSPCSICGKVGHRFYDELDHLDEILKKTNE